MKKIKKQLNKINKLAIICLSFVILVIALVFSLRTSWAAWQEPSSPPPQGNTSLLIDIGPDDQAKAGYLRIDPNFNPNDTPPDNITHALEIKGDGAKINTLNVNGNLVVDNYTLFVNSNTKRVGIGTNTPTAKLSVEGGGLVVAKAPITTTAISATASGANSHGIYSVSTAPNSAGVYGVNNSAGGYGVWGDTLTCAGVYGKGTGSTGIGVMGITVSGNSGVYGINNELAGNYWAGYFKDARLEATDEVVGAKFLPTKLQNSLVPYTTGWEVGSYEIAEHPDYLAFDGTYIWTANNESASFSKIRASDGQEVFERSLPSLLGVPIPLDITFDGSYIWVSYRYGDEDGYISKFDPSNGGILDTYTFDVDVRPNRIISTFDGTNSYIWASSSTGRVTRIRLSDGNQCYYTTGLNNPQGLAFDGNNVWLANYGAGTIIKFDNSCAAVGSVSVGSNPINLIFDGSNLWVAKLTNSGTYNLAKVSLDRGTTNYPVSYYSTGTAEAFNLAFDGTYIWVDHQGHGHLRRVLAADGSCNLVDYNLTGLHAHTGIIFDGTYLWIGQGVDNDDFTHDDNRINKVYTGTGFGHTDLSSMVNLQTSTTGTAQAGNFSTSGTGTIDTNLEVGGDLSVTNNKWGDTADAEIIVTPGSGTYNCPSTGGQFIKGVEINDQGDLISILCRPL